MTAFLEHLPWWIAVLPWCVMILLAGACAPCWSWSDDNAEEGS